MNKLKKAARKALATFLFSSLGVIGTSSLFGKGVLIPALGVGVGALVNLAYRWSEAVLKESDAPNNDAGLTFIEVTLILVVLAIFAIVAGWIPIHG